MTVAAPSNKIPATLSPGDGIGPEIIAATMKALDARGAGLVGGLGGSASTDSFADAVAQRVVSCRG